MNIAYITTGNIYMNSSANIRNIALIKGLEELGHTIKVVSFENGKIRDAGFQKDLESIDVYFIGKRESVPSYQKQNISKQSKKDIIISAIKGKINKLYRHVQIYDPYKHKISEIDASIFNWDDFDICITSSDPKSSHLLALNAKKEGHRFKWVQYWGDPMTLDLTIDSWVRPLICKAEHRLFNAADKIVFTNRASKEVMEKKYPQFVSKFMSIPTSLYLNTIENKKKEINVDSVKLGYYGGCSSINRNVRPLISAVRSNSAYHLILAGGNDLGLKNDDSLMVYGRISSQEVSLLTDDTDILIVLENLPKNENEPCRQTPGKMYHYALMRKPILVICETDSMRCEFEKYDNYYFCKNNQNDIEQTIKAIISDIGKREYHPVKDFMPSTVANQLLSKMS